MENHIKGRKGEAMAKQYLERKGYTVLAMNYRTKSGEIDIVAACDGCIVFVEVKYRDNIKMGFPREAVTWSKRRKIKKTALFYISTENIVDMDIRFDVIEILGGENITLTHLENAFW